MVSVRVVWLSGLVMLAPTAERATLHKTYDDKLVDDDGARVAQVLMETNVRLIPPKLEQRISIRKEESPRRKEAAEEDSRGGMSQKV